MEFLPKHEYLELRPDTLEAVRRHVDLDKVGEMKEAVRILNEWVHQQSHFLKKDFPLAFLETTIVMSKGSIERSKSVLDRMCTMRTLLPKYYMLYDIKKDFQLLRGSSYIILAPKQTKEYHRIVIMKYTGKYNSPKTLDCIHRFFFSLLDYVKLFDYNSGMEVIYDISEIDIKEVMATVDLLELKNVYMNLLECCGLRVKKIHLISASKLVNTLIAFFKQFIKKKFMDRVIIHKKYEELHQYYPKDVLPKEYGGTEKTLLELQDECLDSMSSDEYQQHVKSMSEAKIDETLRPSSQFNDLYAGCYGTIRSLTVD